MRLLLSVYESNVLNTYMRLKRYMTEKFNLNYPVKDISDNNDMWDGSFEVGSTLYSFMANEYFTHEVFEKEDFPYLNQRGWVWEIEFAAFTGNMDSPWDISGKMGGRAQQVFSGVGTLLKKFIKARKPSAFYFSAKEPSRVKLYNHLSKLISKISGYRYEKSNVPYRNTYLFHKK